MNGTHPFLVLSYKRWINYIYYIYIIDPTLKGSTKYRSHAIKEPFRHRPAAIIAFYRRKTGGTKNYGFSYHCVILETRVYIPLKDKSIFRSLIQLD
jgi:hypothetical protein